MGKSDWLLRNACCRLRLGLPSFALQPQIQSVRAMIETSHTRLAEICADLGELDGWDFSHMNTERAPTPWNYDEIVSAHLRSDSLLLDLGTGGGEILLSLATECAKAGGIDSSESMISAANRNLDRSNATNVTFLLMDNFETGFSDCTFDVITNRHAGFSELEVDRILKPGGLFITQQVGRNNTLNVLAAFDWTPDSFGVGYWDQSWQEEIQNMGYEVVTSEQYDVDYWFCDIQSLLFWLKSVPLLAPFDLDRHFRNVERLIASAWSAKGLKTNEHRKLLVARKPL